MKPDRLSTHQWDTSLDPEIVPLFLKLQWAQSQSLHTIKPTLAAHGLSMAEFDVLATLRNAKPPFMMTPKEIQGEVVITSGGLSKVMLQLESRGLVIRLQQEEDRRVKPIRLTPQGKRLIEKAMGKMLNETGAWIRGVLSQNEIQKLTELLDRIA
jgi:DNA-binding MarR family transcriptional regulator